MAKGFIRNVAFPVIASAMKVIALGPDLVTVKNTGKEKLLVNIIDPNREVRPEFASYIIENERR